MRVFGYLKDLSKAVVASRTAQVLFWIHLVSLSVALIQRNSLLPPFHFEYEPTLFNILSVVNAPVSIIAGILLLPVTLLLTSFNLEKSEIALYVFVIFMYVCWQLQSALFGYLIEKAFYWLQKPK